MSDVFLMLRRFSVEHVECARKDHFYTYLLLFLVFVCMQAFNVHVIGDSTE